jgi:cytidyltransferase-like protein
VPLACKPRRGSHMLREMKKIIITSGYFNPLHVGHINLIREAKKLGDFLVVIVNNDEQVKLKGSTPFIYEQERMEIIRALRYADDVVLSIDADASVNESLKMVAKKYLPADRQVPAELVFAKGGDRNSSNIPELAVCQEYNIKIVDGIGGDKVQSSSWLLNKVKDRKS